VYAVICGTLLDLCVAVCCSVLQCVAVCCGTLLDLYVQSLRAERSASGDVAGCCYVDDSRKADICMLFYVGHDSMCRLFYAGHDAIYTSNYCGQNTVLLRLWLGVAMLTTPGKLVCVCAVSSYVYVLLARMCMCC